LAKRENSGKGYVFPEQAAMYLENPDGITWRVRKIFAAAGFHDVEDPPSSDSGAASEGEGDEKALAVAVVNGNGNGNGEAGNGAVAHRGEIHAERKGGLR